MAKKKSKKQNRNWGKQQSSSNRGPKGSFVTISLSTFSNNHDGCVGKDSAGPKKKKDKKRSFGKGEKAEGQNQKKHKKQKHSGPKGEQGKVIPEIQHKKNAVGFGNHLMSTSLCSKHPKELRMYFLIARMEETLGKGLVLVFHSGEESGFDKLVGWIRELTGGRTTGLSIRTPPCQRNLLARRAERALRQVIVMVFAAKCTTEFRGRITAPTSLILAVHFDSPHSVGERNARLSVLKHPEASKVKEYFLTPCEIQQQSNMREEQFPKQLVSKLQARFSVANKLVKVAMRMKAAHKSSEEKSFKTMANLAGFDINDEDSTSIYAAQCADKSMVQQYNSLQKKLAALMTQPILQSLSSDSTKSCDRVALMKKMELLGMLQTKDSEVNDLDDRMAAQTRWLDGAKGSDWGGSWEGVLRCGASCDKTSLEVRRLHEEYLIRQAQLQAANQKNPAGVKKVKLSKKERKKFVTAGWNPNPNCADLEKWGGRWGKPCGHNEVVMHQLRPFFPLEVVNTRVCSKVSPAPGNESFDGCMEFLALQCKRKNKAITLWDPGNFHWISPKGELFSFEKKRMVNLPHDDLRYYIENTRHLTIFTQGQVKHADILGSLIMFKHMFVSKKTKLHECFDAKIAKIILSYLVVQM
eukprot:CAMPEP_0117859072 /NCGR_PEP_ID=MMETSP0950-20121206/2900_1 /TAXON_ID=44440 /ORGANISM="Chattonella subsalsa, Strain CCMP2191" /LENGTH=637 /DNA_ID=CAMNT_0005708845 /DNA_START=97 /DNA_END=2010 /DNA_ORIENTATION=-